MNESITAYPLCWPEGWKRTDPSERLASLTSGRFHQNWSSVVAKLFKQLELMDATDIILSTNLELRRDGRPYARFSKIKIQDPGAAVYFHVKGSPLVMAQDRYSLVIDNIRSIRLSIEGLRQMERHGGGHMMERAFTGFAQLPAPNTEEWWKILGVVPSCSFVTARNAYIDLSKKYHPDLPDGDIQMMAKINKAWEEAKEVLE